MNYSESITPLSPAEKRKQRIILMVIILIPFALAGAGFLLRYYENVWAIFSWVGAGFTVVFLTIPHIFRLVKDDFLSHKIIYKGTVQEVRPVKVGVGTNSSLLYEFVLEKKTLKISEKGLVQIKLMDVPIPVQGEEVEIHALPKSGDIIKLLVNRKGKWESVDLA